MIICNSTVLIYLTKIDRLHLLKDIFKVVLIPKKIKKEIIDQGKRINSLDAMEVEEAIRKGWVKVGEVKIEKILQNIGIDDGEAEAISLALKKKADILLDQTHARDAAKLVGLKPKGTIYVLLLALKKGLITYDNYLCTLLDLIEMGFRMSEEVYIEAIELGKKIKK